MMKSLKVFINKTAHLDFNQISHECSVSKLQENFDLLENMAYFGRLTFVILHFRAQPSTGETWERHE